MIFEVVISLLSKINKAPGKKYSGRYGLTYAKSGGEWGLSSEFWGLINAKKGTNFCKNGDLFLQNARLIYAFL